MSHTDLNTQNKRKQNSKHILRLVVYAMLGTIMFCSKFIMEVLPNIHPVGMLTMVYTLTLRWRALIPLYVYIMLDGLFSGFALWWVPYLYVWTVLWALTMLLPPKMPKKIAYVVYPVICALHGLFFGVLYAPAQALMYGLDFNGMLTWIAAGLAFDITHGIADFCIGLLILPLSELIKKLIKQLRI